VIVTTMLDNGCFMGISLFIINHFRPTKVQKMFNKPSGQINVLK
jgi:hypothetical protein